MQLSSIEKSQRDSPGRPMMVVLMVGAMWHWWLNIPRSLYYYYVVCVCVCVCL